jgi:hypothetical protein
MCPLYKPATCTLSSRRPAVAPVEIFASSGGEVTRRGVPAWPSSSRDDPLLSDRSWAVSSYDSDVAALVAAPTRVVIAVGEARLRRQQQRQGAQLRASGEH